jgi:transcriptional regulator with XRE-family HTH domain
LSLRSVDTLSDHEFHAATLASYERGERLISVVRLARLASIYDVPVDRLLPVSNSLDVIRRVRAPQLPPGGGAEPTPLTIDMARLWTVDGSEADLLRRAIGGIVRLRSEISGPFVTIRGADVAAIGRIFNRTELAMRQYLEELNLLAIPM